METVGSYLQIYRSTRCPRFGYGKLPFQGFLSKILPYKGYSTPWLDLLSGLQPRYRMLMPPVQEGVVDSFSSHLGLSRLPARRSEPIEANNGKRLHCLTYHCWFIRYPSQISNWGIQSRLIFLLLKQSILRASSSPFLSPSFTSCADCGPQTISFAFLSQLHLFLVIRSLC